MFSSRHDYILNRQFVGFCKLDLIRGNPYIYKYVFLQEGVFLSIFLLVEAGMCFEERCVRRVKWRSEKHG